MKKTKNLLKLFVALTAVFFISTTLFLFLFIKTKDLKNQFVDFSNICISSFMTATDLTLCEEDFFLGNVEIGECSKYKDSTLSNLSWARGIWYTNSYNYIGQ